MSCSAAILTQIRSLGYAVSVHRMTGLPITGADGRPAVLPDQPYTEMHAVRLADPSEQHIARVGDGGGPDEEYRCACALAQMVGISLEG